jgi:CRISPR type I-E-associated protein CasB/Cse2
MTSTITALHDLIARILATRATDHGMRSAVESGISPYTETRAYPWVLPYVDSPLNQQAFLRSAAIAARHVKVTHRPGRQVGSSLRSLTTAITGSPIIDPEKPDGIALRLTSLLLLDVDQAADMLDQIISQAAKHDVAFDFQAIGTTLLFWGNGIDDRSTEHRSKLLANYYYSPRDQPNSDALAAEAA